MIDRQNRFVVSFTDPGDQLCASYTQITIVPEDRTQNSVVWVDAIQLESGTEPTPYQPDVYHVVR